MWIVGCPCMIFPVPSGQVEEEVLVLPSFSDLCWLVTITGFLWSVEIRVLWQPQCPDWLYCGLVNSTLLCPGSLGTWVLSKEWVTKYPLGSVVCWPVTYWGTFLVSYIMTLSCGHGTIGRYFRIFCHVSFGLLSMNRCFDPYIVYFNSAASVVVAFANIWGFIRDGGNCYDRHTFHHQAK